MSFWLFNKFYSSFLLTGAGVRITDVYAKSGKSHGNTFSKKAALEAVQTPHTNASLSLLRSIHFYKNLITILMIKSIAKII